MSFQQLRQQSFSVTFCQLACKEVAFFKQSPQHTVSPVYHLLSKTRSTLIGRVWSEFPCFSPHSIISQKHLDLQVSSLPSLVCALQPNVWTAKWEKSAQVCRMEFSMQASRRSGWLIVQKKHLDILMKVHTHHELLKVFVFPLSKASSYMHSWNSLETLFQQVRSNPAWVLPYTDRERCFNAQHDFVQPDSQRCFLCIELWIRIQHFHQWNFFSVSHAGRNTSLPLMN